MLTTYEKIKTLRIQNKLSQDELAKLAGYTDRSSIAKIEAGRIDLTESKLLLFSRALGVSPAYLMGLSDTPPVAPALELSDKEADLIRDYRDASEEIRGAAATMLHTSAETNRRDRSETA